MSKESTTSTKYYRQHTAEHNAGLCLSAEQFNYLKSANKSYGLSLSLSGTASAAGTLAVMQEITLVNGEHRNTIGTYNKVWNITNFYSRLFQTFDFEKRLKKTLYNYNIYDSFWLYDNWHFWR